MEIKEIKISDIKPYRNNAKKHPKEQIEHIIESIKLTKGLKQPIVIDSNNIVVVGHGRLLAAKKLGYETVPCVLADDMTDEEIKAYRIIDNEFSRQSDIDPNMEFEELRELELDMSDFGIELFDMDDIEEVNGYDTENSDNEFFTAKFTFPADKKKQILSYLRKHKEEITQDIIDKVG